MNIFYHADDFGVSLDSSKSIYDCFLNGCLNSVSLIVNSPVAAEAYELIRENVQNGDLRCALHLNFVEGYCVTENGAAVLPHLVDSEGRFNRSFGSLYFDCKGSQKDILKEELKQEIGSQLERYAAITGSRDVSIDSHQHYHMIPLVWDALWEVIESNGFRVRYLRIPVDPFRPVRECGLSFRVPAINYVKWLLLKSCKKRCRLPQNHTPAVPAFFGIPFTCRMEKNVVGKLLGHYLKVAQKNNTDLELMFHPGAIRDTEKLLDKNNPQLVEFYGSEFRDKEKETLLFFEAGNVIVKVSE